MQSHDRSELGLLGVFLATAVGFTALTFDFRSSSAALFPRLMAGVIVVGVVLLLVREYLPEPLRRVVAEPVSLVDQEELEHDATELETDTDDATELETDTDDATELETDTDDATELETDTDDADATSTRAAERPLTPRQFTFAAIAGYVGLSYLFSILVATPLFVLAYATWFGHRRRTALALVVASLLVVFLFIELANAPLGDGRLLPGGGL
ncbi:tripartite tricarboxylate transporter TctB family protein [Natronobeatus ordinarius]|uniref:tripartite tricarboxylate transporter TctB family protein n=1 Tax=Natronobeatus ordinarius TaxID=2963433 RepID=UPI0020CEB244|nr:tripartite tricarboxylate transporter TctB family protein [Natronobeatus ordinarius]